MIKLLDSRTKVLILLGLILQAVLGSLVVRAAPISARVSRVDDTTHLEFEGAKNWNYRINRDEPKKLVITLDQLSPAGRTSLQAYKDPFLNQVSFTDLPDGKVNVIFSLSEEGVEHFDYMTDQPSLLIVDLYKKASEEKKEATAPATPPTPKVAAKKAAVSKTLSSTVKVPGRNPASKEILVVEEEPAKGESNESIARKFGAFDAGDDEFGRFQIKDYEIREEALIASKQNIYLKYPPLMMPVSRLDYWVNIQPEYVIVPKDTKESKEAQLLATLYYRGRTNLFLKTYQYFTKQYPESEYREILQNLLADVYLKRWIKTRLPSDYDLVKNQLSDLIERYAKSPLTKRNQFLMAYINLERGEALPTLENIQKLISLYPKDPEVPYLRFAQAESLMGFKKYDDAAQVYQGIVKDYPGTEFAAQAKYRLGDVSMRSENWKEAVAQYDQALKESKFEASYPNAHFNKGEALFWMENYKGAIAEFAKFIQLFPTHPNGAFAMTRIGELFDILGANKKRSMGAYLESYFRYPDHPGSKLARIRMLTQKIKDMKAKELEKSLKEIETLQGQIGLDGIAEFVNLLVAEGLQARSDFERSFNMLSSYYQQHPSSPHRDVIQNRIRRNIASEIERMSEAKDYIGALKYYEKYSKTWLQNANRIDVAFFRGLSFEQAGVYGEALKLYRETESELKRISGTTEEKERRVQEHLPSIHRVALRIARVLMEMKDPVAAYKSLKSVTEEGLVGEERIERTQLMADLFVQRGELNDAERALALLEADFKDKKELLKPVLVKRAQILNNLKRHDEAIKSVESVVNDVDGAPQLRAQAFMAKADAQIALGQKASAIDTLQKMLEQLESKVPMETARYRLGELLYEKGDLTSAESVWKKLEGVGGNVLWKIAAEKLETAKFQKDYSRYIQRIPAMSKESPKGGM